MSHRPFSPIGPRETEIKLALESDVRGRALLARAGFAPLHERAFESNLVFDNPSGDLLRSRRLLRLRAFRGQAIVTFKGPPEGGPHKTRLELETTLGDFDSARRILEGLGYGVVFRYDKFRTTFSRPGDAGHAVLDETPIGAFLELEGEAGWIDRTADALGFTRADYIVLSYGALYQDWSQRHADAPPDMVFPRPPL